MKISDSKTVIPYLIEKLVNADVMVPAMIVIDFALNMVEPSDEVYDLIIAIRDKCFHSSTSEMVEALKICCNNLEIDEEKINLIGFQFMICRVISSWWEERYFENGSIPCTRSWDNDLNRAYWLYEMLRGRRAEVGGALVSLLVNSATNASINRVYEQLVTEGRLVKDAARFFYLETGEVSRRQMVEQDLIGLLTISDLTGNSLDKAEKLKAELIQLVDLDGGAGEKYVLDLWNKYREQDTVVGNIDIDKE